METNLSIDFFLSTLEGLVIFIIAGSIHEFAHAFSAYILGDDTAKDEGRMTINPLAHIDPWGTLVFPLFAAFSRFPVFGWMRPVPVNPFRFKNPSAGHALTAFAGPFSNYLQASLGIVLLKAAFMIAPFFPESAVVAYIVKILWTYVTINLLLMVFNLLPFPPLDGGWILRHFLPENLKMFYDDISRFGFLILYVMMFLGVLDYLLAPVYFIRYVLLLNVPDMNLLLTSLPLCAGILVLGMLFRKNIHAFLRRERFTRSYNLLEKNKERAGAGTDPLHREGKNVMAELERGAGLSPKSRDFISTLRAGLVHVVNLCNDADFSIDDAHCRACENFAPCLVRRADQAGAIVN